MMRAFMRKSVVAALLICVAHAAAVLILGTSPAGSFASNAFQVCAALVSALAGFTAARRSSGLARRFWTLVGVAFLLWTAGQATYTYHENWLGQRVPQPSWTHFLFRVYGAPLLMALLIAQDEEEEGGHSWQRILDAAQVGILFLLFYFDLYFVPGGQSQGLTLLYLWGFFDLSDLENWSLFVAFLVRGRFSQRLEERALALRFAPYLLAYAAGSTFFNYSFYTRTVQTGDGTDLVFTLSLGLATLIAATWKSEVSSSAMRERVQGVAWTPALLPLATLALAVPMARSQPTVAFIAVFGSFACFGARLLLTLYRRRRLGEALRASELRYSRLLNLAPDAIFVHTGGRITFANPATARMLGLNSPADVVGRHVLEFAPADLREQFAPRVKGSAEGDTALVVLRRDGTRVLLEAVGMSIDAAPDRKSEVTRLVIARDVTERRRAEVERESLIHALEAKNAELERFTYTASHDLRSPLVTIGSYLRHVEDAAARGDKEALAADIDRIRRATVRMDRLLKDLLELSRVGHVIAPPAPLSFAEIAEEAVDLVRGRLAQGGIGVEVQADLPLVYGDRGRLVEVLQNLIDNAAKFMGDQAAPRIEIGARPEGEETVFFVRDNGMGIDPAHHERVFGLFDKLDPRGEGTGVGLALVKRIVELHRGRIWVESSGALRGAAFCFTLPGPPVGSAA